jgi:hypothetical protein
VATPAIIGTIATTSFSTATGGTNINLPTGITTGELLCIDVAFENDSTAGSITGWTTELSANHTNYTNFAHYRRDADETEGTTVSLSFASGGRDAIARAYRMTGVDLAEAVVYATTRGAIADTDPPSITYGWTGDTQTFAYVTGDDVTITGAPSGYTELYNVVNGKANMALWEKTTPPTASPEDPGVVTMGSNRRWQATTWAIKGTAAGGTTFNRAAVISSASTLTATRVNSFNRASAITGASTVTASAIRSLNRTAAVTSASTVTALSVKSINRAVTVSSVSSVTALGVRVFNRSTTISSAATTTASATRTLNRAAAVTSVSALTALGTKSVNRTTSMVGTSSLTAVGQRTLVRTVTIAGNSTVASLAVRVFNRSVAVTSNSTLSAVYSGAVTYRAANINSASTITLSYAIISMTGRNLNTAVLVESEDRSAQVAKDSSYLVHVEQEDRSINVHTRRNAA